MSSMTIAELAAELAAARTTEAQAKERRIQIEEAILSQVQTPEKGTTTVDAGNGLKVSIKTELSYKADVETIELIDSDLIRVSTTKALDARAYEALREKDPALFDKVSLYVTTQPKKPALTLKVA